MEGFKDKNIKLKNNRLSNLLLTIFTKTYRHFLTDEEINLRINYIIKKINRNDDVRNIMKTILYSDTTNEIGKLAIDFRLGFISDSYEQYINSGDSYEIDNIFVALNDRNNKGKKISQDNYNKRIKFDEELKGYLIVINYIVNMYIMNEELISFKDAHNELNNVIDHEYIIPFTNGWNLHDKIQHIMSLNQVLFMVVYDINPFTNKKPNEQYKNTIKSNFKYRYELFELIKNKHPMLIDNLNYVLETDFFG